MKRGSFEIIESKKIYDNPWISVVEDSVIDAEGKKGLFGVIDYGQGVVVVAINKKGEVYLVKEFFYALNTSGLGLPVGGIDKDETPLEAAKRELKEETGVTAKNWQELGITHPLTMILSCPQHLFLATDIEEGTHSEKDIEVSKVPFEKAYQMALSGEIMLAPSCVAIMRAKKILA